MIRVEELPIEVMNEFHAALLHGESYAEAFVAALNAWPEMECRPTFGPSRIILPLPQEASDE